MEKKDKKKFRLTLPVQMFLGLGLGIAAGAVSSSGFAETWLKPLGDIFIRMIKMVVVPLVLATLVSGAAQMNDVSKLGRVAGKTLLYYAATTGIAVAFGIVFGLLFQPGAGMALAGGAGSAAANPPRFADVLLNIVPVNPFSALVEGNMLQVIFFALLIGFALASTGEKGKNVLLFFDGLGAVMIRVTDYVMHCAPFGVFGLMAFTVSKYGISVLMPLSKLIIAMYIACALIVFFVYFPSVKYTGISFREYLRQEWPPLLIGFSTASSAAAMASNLQAVRRLGASKAISSFSIPLGNTINMNGTALYCGLCTVFAAEAYGLHLGIADYVTIVAMGLLAAIGTAGVPGAGVIMISIVFTQLKIPLEAIALIAGIDRVLDMARTPINVLGDATAALAVTKSEGELGRDPFDEAESAEENKTA